MADQGLPAGDPQPGGFDAVPSQGSNGNELHEQFISSVPENLRDAARELAPHWDKYVQPKFQEHATFRKQYEPYGELGLTELQPEQVQQALNLHRAIQDPQQIVDVYSQLSEYMKANNLLPGTEDDGDLGGEFEDEFDTDPRLMQTVTQMQQQMQQVSGWIQQQQEQAAQAQAQQFVESQLEQIRKDNPGFTKEDEDAVCTMALKYDGQDAISRGLADYKALLSRAEQGLFAKKTDAPDPANSGGTPSTQPSPVTSFEDARAAAMNRLTQSAGL